MGGATTRDDWLTMLDRIARPVLTALSKRQLIKTMPIETYDTDREFRANCTHLEALGRLLTGIAPWVELSGGDAAEIKLREHYRTLVSESIAAGVDSDSPDYLFRNMTHQHLVDAAFLAHGILRAPEQLWQVLPSHVQQQLIDALESTRHIRPGNNNWLLFSAMVETALHHMGRGHDVMRVDYAVRQHLQWYKGDGMYGDGPDFHFDYYNSYVIQPMLQGIVDEFADAYTADDRQRIERRAVRYAAILERMIMLDGSFPAVGRSICYRGGAFHLLADMALRQKLPNEIAPAQVRCALTAMIHKTMMTPGTFSTDGYLRIGLCGAQPALAEQYISTGSLYLCSTLFLPLGLPPEHSFWSGSDTPWTQKRVWSETNAHADHAYSE